MSQDYVIPTGLDKLRVAIKTRIANALEALRSHFSGTAAPGTPVAGQPFFDTTTGILYLRNVANTQWVAIANASDDLAIGVPGSQFVVPSLSATTTLKLGAAPRAGTILGVAILAETATSGSSGSNEWRPMLRKRTVASPGSTVDLFSGTVGTFTTLSGVYTAGELVAHKVALFLANQNAAVGALDVLELVMTKQGTPTSPLVNVSAWALMR